MNKHLSQEELTRNVQLSFYSAMIIYAEQGIECLHSYIERITKTYESGEIKIRALTNLRGDAQRGINALKAYIEILKKEKEEIKNK